MPKTLSQKFFLKENYSIAVINAPDSFLTEQLAPLPAGTALTTSLPVEPVDVQIYFLTTEKTTHTVLNSAKPAMKPKAMVWLCYPKGGAKAKIPTDLNRDILWEIAITHGFKAIHQISIDETWSALRFRIPD